VSPDDYLNKAMRAIASARLLLDAGDVDGACNRAYYAMFDAAHAALLQVSADSKPAETKTHRGLIAAFGNHLVKPGILSVEFGKSLNQVERIRLLADYTLHGRRRGQRESRVGFGSSQDICFNG
jgi:uncharacterized protein (UPF0332 family)